jgi:hypothetical protein
MENLKALGFQFKRFENEAIADNNEKSGEHNRRLKKLLTIA